MEYKRPPFRTLSAPSPASSMAPYTYTVVVDDNSQQSVQAAEPTRYPTRFRSADPKHARSQSVRQEPAKMDRSVEFQLQRLKNLNAELQAKLQMKNTENSQLRLDISRLKTEHERAMRQAVSQQKMAADQMARMLKHAEDVIREKEKQMSRQQDMIGKLSTNSAGSATTRKTPARMTSFHGRTEHSKTGSSQTSTPPSIRRSLSTRSRNGTPPSVSGSSIHRSDSGKYTGTRRSEMSNRLSPPSSTGPQSANILDLSQKSVLLQRRNDDYRSQFGKAKNIPVEDSGHWRVQKEMEIYQPDSVGSSASKPAFICPESLNRLPEVDQFWKSEYHKLLKERKELEKEADELRERVRGYQLVAGELNGLKQSLSSLRIEYQAIKSERDEYYQKSANLDSLVKSLREAAAKRKELEREQEVVQAELSAEKEKVSQLHKNEVVGKRKHQEAIEALESKIRELQKKCDLQEVHHEELSLELDALTRKSVKTKMDRERNTVNSEVQTSPESGTSTPDSALSSLGTAGASGTAVTATNRMVNGESSRQTAPKPARIGNQKTDSGLGSSLDESISSRKDTIGSSRSRAIPHPLTNTVDRAIDVIQSTESSVPKLSVFVARFTYNPAKHSPNDLQEQELELRKGEFVIVFGDMDEDGFYEAETLNGQRGLVGNNLIERLPPEELVDFHNSYPNNPAITSGASGPPAISGASLQSMHFTGGSSQPQMRHRTQQNPPPSSAELTTARPSSLVQSGLPSSIASRDPSNEDPNVPPPSNLALEKQMHKSIMISWTPAPGPPQPLPGQSSFFLGIDSYNVYVNGSLRCSVGANERCRALIEGIDLSGCHRVSVRSRTTNGRESMDTLCTVLVGQNCPVLPAQLRVTNITANSATISWIPANSNYQHSIYVDDHEFAIMPATVNRFTIPDLTASTVYKVRVVPIIPKSTLDYSSYQQACGHVQFKTLPDNVPDPPATLQLESGPQDGTLLLTWTPVVPQRNCDVLGYAIYADGQKVKQIDSPTGDHALLDITRLQPPVPRNFTVRTISSKSLSRDSPYLSVTEDLLLGRVKAVAQAQISDPPYAINQPQLASQQASQPQITLLQPAPQPFAPPSTTSPLPPQTPLVNRQPTVKFQEPPFRQNIPGRLQNQNQSGSPDMFGNSAADDLMSEIIEDTEAAFREPRPFFDPRRPQNRGNMRPFPGESYRDLPFPPGHPGFQLRQPFSNLRIGPRPPYGPFPPDIRGFPPGRLRQDLRNPDRRSREDFYRNAYDDDFAARERMDDEMYQPPFRAYSLPQIEITKEDSFESMDSRHRAYSDREEERRQGGPHSRFNSPPNERNYRPPRHRSQSRDRYAEDPGRSQYRQEMNNYDYQDERPGRRFEGPSGRMDGPSGRRDQDGRRMDQRGGAYGRDDRKKEAGGQASAGNTLERKPKQPPRVFKANFDYDSTMSPNVDADGEELYFKQGQLIKVYGDKDTDGFYKGEIHGTGRQGLVPCNLVSEVTDEATVRKVLGSSGTLERGARQSSMKESRGQAGQSNKQPKQAVIQPPKQTGVRKMIALYDYDSKSNSPNIEPDMELSFKKGETIYIRGEMDDDGFFEGELNGQKGLVPSNFLREASSSSNTNTLTRSKTDSSAQQPQPSTSQSYLNNPPPIIREPHQQSRSSNQNQTPQGPRLAPAPGAPGYRPGGVQTSVELHGPPKR